MTRPRLIPVLAPWIVALVGPVALGIACQSRTPGPPAPAQDQQPGAYLAASPGDRIPVAEVDGVAIYSDCVVTQSEALGVTREQALQQCIDFELLAQAAQRRGKAGDPEVLRTARTESVRRLLDAEVTEPLPDPGAGPGTDSDRRLLEDAYQRYRDKLYRPEIRQVAHVLAAVARDTAEGSPDDRRARALAEDIHAALAARRDLTADDFVARAREVAGDRPLGPSDPKTGEFRREEFKVYLGTPNIHPAFVEAAFAVAGAGQVSRPVRSHVGWHVILVTEIEPPRNATADQVADTLIELLRRERYVALVDALQKNARIEVNEQALGELQAAEDALRFAPSESP